MEQLKEKDVQIARGAYATSVLKLMNNYHAKARNAKRKYQIVRVLIISGSVLIPVLVNLPGIDTAVVQGSATLVGLIVAILGVVEIVFGFRESWVTYNSISLFIDKEWHFYTYRIRDYADLDDKMAFKLFVERIESELSSQHTALLEKQSRPSTEGQASQKAIS